MTFKVGDRVRYIYNSDSLSDDYKAVVGCVGTVIQVTSLEYLWPYEVHFEGFNYQLGVKSHPCDAGELELVQDRNGMEWSEWQLANPGVTIPDNAVVAKAEDGSVVCFKVPVGPKRETSTVWWMTEGATVYGEHSYHKYTHKITFETIDGKPDCSTIRMEEL